MKISIAYLPEEHQAAGIIKRVICATFGGVKVRKSDRHPPFIHIYLTTTKPEKPNNSGDNA